MTDIHLSTAATDAATNARRANLIHGVPALVSAILLAAVVWWLVPWFIAVLAAVGTGVFVAWWSSRSAVPIALRSVAAERSEPSDNPRYHNLVDGLCVAAGVRVPTLHVIDDPAANALATGSRSDRASLAVTSGLLERLNPVELEGVLAHCLARIATNEIAPATALLPILARLGPLGAKTRSAVIDEHHLWRSDVAAVATTQYPPGLIGALDHMRTATEPHRAGPALDHLWIIPAGAEPRDLDVRIAALREL